MNPRILNLPIEQQILWASGILEGEGCFSFFKRKERLNTASIAIHCEMTDEDTINTLHNVFKEGSVVKRLNMSGRRDTRPRKPTWIWSVQNKNGVLNVLLQVMPYLHSRRLEKAKQLLDHIEKVGYND